MKKFRSQIKIKKIKLMASAGLWHDLTTEQVTENSMNGSNQ